MTTTPPEPNGDNLETTKSPGAEETSLEEAAALRLTNWLCRLVHTRDLGALADLRRRDARTPSRLRAEWFAAVDEAEAPPDHREIFHQVAFLFARYHAGRDQPRRGHGSLGTALRRVGSPAMRGPNDAGATRLMDRIAASRSIPERHLQHAVERLRAAEATPPAWTRLTVDLLHWHDRNRPIAYRWATDFYTPPRSANGANR